MAQSSDPSSKVRTWSRSGVGTGSEMSENNLISPSSDTLRQARLHFNACYYLNNKDRSTGIQQIYHIFNNYSDFKSAHSFATQILIWQKQTYSILRVVPKNLYQTSSI